MLGYALYFGRCTDTKISVYLYQINNEGLMLKIFGRSPKNRRPFFLLHCFPFFDMNGDWERLQAEIIYWLILLTYKRDIRKTCLLPLVVDARSAENIRPIFQPMHVDLLKNPTFRFSFRICPKN